MKAHNGNYTIVRLSSKKKPKKQQLFRFEEQINSLENISCPLKTLYVFYTL